MASIHVIFDPKDRVSFGPDHRDVEHHLGIKMARLSISDDLESVDIYNAAKKLCELLLEQIDRSES